MKQFLVKGKLWRYPLPGGWYFVYVGDKESKTLKENYRGRKVGWSYIPVIATLGKTSWQTTLFPTKEGPYLLAIKGAVRQKEGVRDGDVVRIQCRSLQ